jgi:hypothetical protein
MNSPRPRPVSRLVLALAAVAVTVLGLVGPATAAEPYCGITWGSTAEEARGPEGAAAPAVTGVRAGRQACFDRMVVDLAGAAGAGYAVRYVAEVTRDGSGFPVPLRGGAFLQVVVLAHGEGLADRSELVDTAGFATLRQVASAGAFEGQTTLGVGVRARLPFRVFTLAGPGTGGRLVLDVAHGW